MRIGETEMAKREKVDSMKVLMEVNAGKLNIRIKNLREARRMSQNELARAAEMTVQNLQKIEQGYTKAIPYETLDAICKALNYPTKKMMKPSSDETSEDEAGVAA